LIVNKERKKEKEKKDALDRAATVIGVCAGI
jgi:hypothetical protein